MKNRCNATAKRTGERCRRSPIPGGAVCRVHGGAAPQVRRSARRRLAALVDPALAALSRALGSSDDRTATRAAQIVLDRNGYGPRPAVRRATEPREYLRWVPPRRLETMLGWIEEARDAMEAGDPPHHSRNDLAIDLPEPPTKVQIVLPAKRTPDGA